MSVDYEQALKNYGLRKLQGKYPDTTINPESVNVSITSDVVRDYGGCASCGQYSAEWYVEIYGVGDGPRWLDIEFRNLTLGGLLKDILDDSEIIAEAYERGSKEGYRQ